MPVIEVAAGIPCPQTSTVTPEERRLLSEGAYGPRGARTIELDERQFQTLTWALSAVQAALFRDWYRTTLTYGGAWFSAPATWPTPEGLVVKVRRFIGDPQWTYRGNGHWLLALNAEVRGETLLPSSPDIGIPWLYFDEGTNWAPLADANASLSAPIAFVDGVGAVNDDGFGSNEQTQQDVIIPLYSLNSLPTEGVSYTWSPASGAELEPTVNAGVYEFSTGWEASNFYVFLAGGGPASGWAGGVLTLYSGNDITGSSGATVITFLPSSAAYPPASIEYVGPA
jgi:hypothetical protein